MPTEPQLSKAEFDRLHGMPKSGYRIEINREGNWAESEYVWKVFLGDSIQVLWSGSSEWSRKAAERQAKRAIKKLRKGKTQEEPVKYPYTLWMYP